VDISFWIWLTVLVGIAGFGLSAMISAYWGRGSVAVVFPEPLAPDPVPTLSPEAATQFQLGCEQYRAGSYRQAVTCFVEALRLDPQFAEAQHNRARATANLRRITEAISELVKASDLYSQQGDGEMLIQLKQDLAVIGGSVPLSKTLNQGST
jgi:tetratricopeptide (TPR) repeat protein